MKGLIIIVIVFFSAIAKSQDITSLPVVAYASKIYNVQKALVLYMSGDGGENAFSASFMLQVSNKGYPAVLFNSQKYFWSKKTPEQTASDAEKIIKYYQSKWKIRNVIIIGMPQILQKLLIQFLKTFRVVHLLTLFYNIFKTAK